MITQRLNIDVIKEIGRRTDIADSQFYTNLDRYANTAEASLLIALDEYLDNNDGEEDIFLVFLGGGLSWGGCYLRKISSFRLNI